MIDLDSVDHLFLLLKRVAEKHPDAFAVRMQTENGDINVTYKTLLKEVSYLAFELKEKFTNKKIALIGEFCYEWIIGFFSIVASNNTVVVSELLPDKTTMQNRFRFCDIATILSSEKGVFSDETNNIPVVSIIASKYTEPDIIERQLNYADSNLSNKLALIAFTSGTSGNSKAVMLTHQNIIENVKCAIDIIGEETVFLGENIVPILPPYHMFQITAGFLTPICYGVSICFSKNTLFEKIKYFSPSILLAVPMVLDGINKHIYYSAKREHSLLLLKATKTICEKLRIKKSLKKIIFGSIHKALGGRLKIIVCGGASANNKTVKSLENFGLEILLGYGMTECSPIIACNRKKNKKIGSVGIPVLRSCCNIKIDNSEILVNGSIVFDGYYKDQKETEKAFKNGWFATGDIGYFDEEGYLFITGRKKNIIVLPSGENLSPEGIENQLIDYPYIMDAIVALIEKKSISLLSVTVYPDYEYCDVNNISSLNEKIENAVKTVNQKNPRYERIDKVIISSETALKTSTNKVTRTKNC